MLRELQWELKPYSQISTGDPRFSRFQSSRISISHGFWNISIPCKFTVVPAISRFFYPIWEDDQFEKGRYYIILSYKIVFLNSFCTIECLLVALGSLFNQNINLIRESMDLGHIKVLKSILFVAQTDAFAKKVDFGKVFPPFFGF